MAKTSDTKIKNDLEIMAIKSTLLDVGWKQEYISNMLELVTNVRTLVSHTYFLSKFIFIQELEKDDTFNLKEYVDKAFFKEVFLSLVDYESRGNSAVGKTRRMREMIQKYMVAYREHTSYVLIKIKHASQMAKYESIKISTAYLNGVLLQFGNYVRMFLNKLVNLKSLKADLKKKLKNQGCSEKEAKEKIETCIITPLNQVKHAVPSKDITKFPAGILKPEQRLS